MTVLEAGYVYVQVPYPWLDSPHRHVRGGHVAYRGVQHTALYVQVTRPSSLGIVLAGLEFDQRIEFSVPAPPR